jgi:hypothetical protein
MLKLRWEPTALLLCAAVRQHIRLRMLPGRHGWWRENGILREQQHHRMSEPANTAFLCQAERAELLNMEDRCG